MNMTNEHVVQLDSLVAGQFSLVVQFVHCENFIGIHIFRTGVKFSSRAVTVNKCLRILAQNKAIHDLPHYQV